jgi:hypothetical protein
MLPTNVYIHLDNDDNAEAILFLRFFKVDALSAIT